MLPEIFASLDAFQGWFDFDNLGDVSGREQVIAQEQRSKYGPDLSLDAVRPTLQLLRPQTSVLVRSGTAKGCQLQGLRQERGMQAVAGAVANGTPRAG